MTVAQHVEIFDLAFGVVFGVAHQDRIAGGARGRFDALHDLEIEGVADVAHHHQHGHGFLGAQVAGADIGR